MEYVNSEELRKIVNYIDEGLLNDSLFEKLCNDNVTKTEHSAIIKDIENKMVTSGRIPLQQFTTADICSFIENWVYNDIEYKRYLKEIQSIFVKNELNGMRIRTFSTYDIQLMVEHELLNFMTSESVKIAFAQFNEWRKDKKNQ
eukprot:187227_1